MSAKFYSNAFLFTLLTTTVIAITYVAHAASCRETQGKVIDVEIPTPHLFESTDAKVYVPACYDNTANARYPVLYLLHGMNNVAEQWVTIGAPAAADKLIADGEIAPMIIVMPHDRMENYFDVALVDEIVPFIDANFKTIPDRDHRAIGGLSYGGGWALHIGLNRSDLFSRIGGHSPSLFYSDAVNLKVWAQSLPKGTTIQVDSGWADPMLASNAMIIDALLSNAGARHIFLVRAGGHEEVYWSAHLAEYLRFYAASW